MYNSIKQSFQQGRHIFITGPGGTGKSYNVNRLCNDFPFIVKTSTTGVSALNIGGQTLHSWGGIGIAEGSVDDCFMKACIKQETMYRLQHTRAIVIDEVSMLDVEYFLKLRKVIQKIRNNDKVFGGIQCIFVGDFFQIPPIKQLNNWKYIFQTPIWDQFDFKMFKLEKSYRQENLDFFNLLNKVRTGQIDQGVIQTLESRIVKTGDTDRTTLFARRKGVEAFNKRKYKQLPGVPEVFDAKNSYNNVGNNYQVMAEFKRQCIVPQKLELKVGTKVVLCKNLSKTYVNGSVGIVSRLNMNAVWVDFGDGRDTHVKSAPFERVVNGEKYTIYQIPLIYGWAITMHKAQGLTMSELHINFAGIFQHSMAYVALSRVKSLDGLTISNFHPSKLYTDSVVKNFYDNL